MRIDLLRPIRSRPPAPGKSAIAFCGRDPQAISELTDIAGTKYLGPAGPSRRAEAQEVRVSLEVENGGIGTYSCQLSTAIRVPPLSTAFHRKFLIQ